MPMFAEGDALEGGSGLALTTSDEEGEFAIGVIADFLFGDDIFGIYFQVTKVGGNGEVFFNGTADSDNFSTSVEGNIDGLLETGDAGGDGGDDKFTFAVGYFAGKHFVEIPL